MRPPETPKARPPVVMFAYRRPDHLRRTLAALAANDGASETHVILHSDGPRGAADAAAVKAVRKVAQEAVGSGAFGDFAIVAQDRNKGWRPTSSMGSPPRWRRMAAPSWSRTISSPRAVSLTSCARASTGSRAIRGSGISAAGSTISIRRGCRIMRCGR
ncbi:MAG: hypothetical protein JKP98_15565 [Rhodobacteraceae bacterium]|nr:hypothetical protein [Paracoccaceae bacterium]